MPAVSTVLSNVETTVTLEVGGVETRFKREVESSEWELSTDVRYITVALSSQEIRHDVHSHVTLQQEKKSNYRNSWSTRSIDMIQTVLESWKSGLSADIRYVTLRHSGQKLHGEEGGIGGAVRAAARRTINIIGVKGINKV